MHRHRKKKLGMSQSRSYFFLYEKIYIWLFPPPRPPQKLFIKRAHYNQLTCAWNIHFLPMYMRLPAGFPSGGQEHQSVLRLTEHQSVEANRKGLTGKNASQAHPLGHWQSVGYSTSPTT